MKALIWISIIPILASILAISCSNTGITRKFVPALIWAQVIALLYILNPVLNFTTQTLVITTDFCVDRISALFLLLTTVVVASSLTHAYAFFRQETLSDNEYKPQHERIFYACASLFLLSMIFVFLSNNLGFLWISIEATTLSSASLVYFSRTKHALEATWKYLIICSVGIAFALFGTILIFASSQHGALPHGSLNLKELLDNASRLQYSLLRFGYIFCLLGYGTKAGIFPLHSWLPDAHSEAPAPASAMLSGALLNCALFAIWRLSELLTATHHGNAAYYLPLTLGTITTLAAAFFLVRQHNIKRLWAYSSIENVGLMLVAIGFGSAPLFFLQALNHSIAKVSLFLLSGNIIQATGKKELSEIHGILQTSPVWGILMAISAFAVTGAPPFGAFISEWFILVHSAEHNQWLIVTTLIVALALSFIAVSIHVGRMLFGTSGSYASVFKPFATSLIPAILTICVIVTGITFIPSCLVTLP